MPNFEEMGRALDRELERLRELAETTGAGSTWSPRGTKVKPATCDKAAKVLPSVSESLSRLAQQIDSKNPTKKSS
jgi:hypothetical protein